MNPVTLDNVYVWIEENYEPAGDWLRCRRCGMDNIFAVIKHAVTVHGDPIAMLPSQHPEIETDEQGRAIL